MLRLPWPACHGACSLPDGAGVQCAACAVLPGGPTAGFPPSDSGLPPLPLQVPSLKQLQYLSLAYCPLRDEELAPLTALTQLTLEQCFHIPESLSQLTQLRVLRIDGSPQYDEERPAAREALLAALPQLQSLTHLAFGDMNWLGSVPAEVGSLTQLARFCWHNCVAGDARPAAARRRLAVQPAPACTTDRRSCRQPAAADGGTAAGMPGDPALSLPQEPRCAN